MAQAAQVLTPPSSFRQTATPFLAYKVRPNETLSKILTQYYGAPYGSPDYLQAQTLVQYSNPEIKDIHKIYPGQIIRLFNLVPSELAFCPKPSPLDTSSSSSVEQVSESEIYNWLENNGLQMHGLKKLEHHWPSSSQEQDAFFTLAWLEQNYGIMAVSTAAGLNSFDGIVNQSNRALLAEVKVLWGQYQAGKITQNQYNYRRQRALNKFAQKVGPFEKLLFKGKTTREAISISRSKAIPATAKIDRQLNRLSRMARASKYGGIALSAASAAVACHQIANTEDRHEKNEIFVETLGSTIVGSVASAAITVMLFSNPVGWGVALVVGTATAVGSYAAGKGAVKLYDLAGRDIDLVEALGVGKVCR